jgi:hypothetical protein
MVDLFCKSYRRPPQSITLDIDDTCDTVHGHQQLSLFNAHYDERWFLPRLGSRLGEVGPVDFSGHRNRGSIQGFDES